MWFILKSVSYTLEKTVFSTIVGGIFYVCLFCLAGFSATQVFCFISTFCLVVLSIFRSVMSKSQIIIVELYISPSNSVHFFVLSVLGQATDSYLHLLNSGSFLSFACGTLHPVWPQNTLKTVMWNNHRAHLICFLSQPLFHIFCTVFFGYFSWKNKSCFCHSILETEASYVLSQIIAR